MGQSKGQFRLYLFGTPRVERNGVPIELNLRKGLALLVYVAVTRQVHSRDTLATLLWPEKDQQAARANLRRILYDLGQLLGEQVLDTTSENVSLAADARLWLDIEHYQKHIAEYLPPDSPDSPIPLVDEQQLSHLVEAVDLYTADFMAGFTLPDCPEFDDWQYFQREELRTSFAALLEYLVFAHEAQQRWEDALHYARRWLAIDPLEEPVHRRLMQLYAQAGQTGAALRQYEECKRILAEELDASPEEETTALYEAIRTRRFPTASKATQQQHDLARAPVAPVRAATPAVAAMPQSPVAPLPPSTLPMQTTPFVGRQQEMAELLRHLRDPSCRLLTIVGPGGIGKTRLALEVAQAVLEPMRASDRESAHDAENATSDGEQSTFKDGSFFVPLQTVNAPSGVISAIAGALGLQFYGGAPAEQQLHQFLHEKELLLVLDNFEQLLDGANLVAEMLAAAPRIKVLVTSREALKLHEEWFHPLAGMRLPPVTSLPPDATEFTTGSSEDIASYDAVQFFIQTARRSLATFEPENELETIIRICRLVDGMPLGIELAASWLRVLSCTQIAQEIENGIDILVARHQNVPARHRSIRAVLEHSWQLLDEATQQVLQRLSVFHGGFMHDASTVVGANLLTLADLVDKSWIYRSASGRYQMHDLLRQFTADRLAESATEKAETLDRHAAFYLRHVAQRQSALIGPEQRAALDEIDAEIDNVRAAWHRAVAQQSFDLVNSALHVLCLFFQTRSRYAEAEELFAQTLRHLEETLRIHENDEAIRLRVRLLGRLGYFHLYQGDLDEADRCFEIVLSNSQDPRELALLYMGMGQVARLRGDRAAAEAALQQSLALARTNQDRHQMAESLKALSDIASSWADFAKAKQLATEALTLCQQLQLPDLTAKVLAGLAWATNCLGGYAESEKYYRESLAISEAIGMPYGIALATRFLGWVAFCQGGDRLIEALSLHSQALVIWRQTGQRSNLAMSLTEYALAASELGDHETALRYAQEALMIGKELDNPNLQSYTYYALGAAACGLNDLATSRRYLLRSLQISSRAHLSDNSCAALYFLALLLVKESKLPPLSADERMEKQRRALELLALVIHHRTTWQLFRDRALRVQVEVVEGLPVEIATAAIERGKERTLEEVMAEIFDEPEPFKAVLASL